MKSILMRSIEETNPEFVKKAVRIELGKRQEKWFEKNRDIAEWQAYLVNSYGSLSQSYVPAAEMFMKKALMLYKKERDGDLEEFVTEYVNEKLRHMKCDSIDVESVLVEDEWERKQENDYVYF